MAESRFKYTTEEMAKVMKVAKADRSKWKDLVPALSKELNRGIRGIYNKVNDVATVNGNPPTFKTSNKHKDKPKPKTLGNPKPTILKKKKKGSRMHPMRKSNELSVSQHELRFPFKSIRIEGGEFIVNI